MEKHHKYGEAFLKECFLDLQGRLESPVSAMCSSNFQTHACRGLCMCRFISKDDKAVLFV